MFASHQRDHYFKLNRTSFCKGNNLRIPSHLEAMSINFSLSRAVIKQMVCFQFTLPHSHCPVGISECHSDLRLRQDLLSSLRNRACRYASLVNANFSVNQMCPIICRWKLVKHPYCFGDNRRTKDNRKIRLCGLKACCVT